MSWKLIGWLLLGLLVPGNLWGNEAATTTDTPQALLRLMQIDDSLLDQFVDDRPLDESEQETLLRILYRLPAFPQLDLDRWAQPLPKDSTIDQVCSQHRFDIFEFAAIVEAIERKTIIPELVERLGFSSYYQLTVRLAKGTTTEPAIVLARALPKAWQQAEREAQLSTGQQIKIQGMLLKQQIVDGQPGLVFATPRIRWYPTAASPGLEVTPNQILLAKMGVDIGTLADVRHRETMRPQDRESFYQMLAAVHHAEPKQFERLGQSQLDMASILRRPESLAGELYSLRGTARRALRIKVSDAEIRERFGLHQYFEVTVFVPMERPVRFVDEDSQERVFRDYPFVFCVPELPESMPRGENINLEVRCAGFFLKLWSYRSEFMSQVRTRDDRPAQQLSPLLIGPSISPIPTTAPPKTPLSLIISVLFVSAIGITWCLLWRASIRDKQKSRELFRKNLPADASFHKLEELSEET